MLIILSSCSEYGLRKKKERKKNDLINVSEFLTCNSFWHKSLFMMSNSWWSPSKSIILFTSVLYSISPNGSSGVSTHQHMLVSWQHYALVSDRCLIDTEALPSRCDLWSSLEKKVSWQLILLWTQLGWGSFNDVILLNSFVLFLFFNRKRKLMGKQNGLLTFSVSVPTLTIAQMLTDNCYLLSFAI